MLALIKMLSRITSAPISVMNPMPPILAARLYTKSIPSVAFRQFPRSLRSRSSSSSQYCPSPCPLNVTSATLTMFPLFRSSLARWAPMNPPPPVTSMRLIARPFPVLRNASYMQSYGSPAILITLPFPPCSGRKLQIQRGQSHDIPSYCHRGTLGHHGGDLTQFLRSPEPSFKPHHANDDH